MRGWSGQVFNRSPKEEPLGTAHTSFLQAGCLSCHPTSLSLSILTGHSPGEHGLAVCLLKQMMMEVVSGEYWTTGAISHAKLQSNHHHQQTNTKSFLQVRCPSCRPTNSVTALNGTYHILSTCLPEAHLGVFQLCLWPLIAPGYLGEVCHAFHQPSDAASTPLMPVPLSCHPNYSVKALKNKHSL